MVLKLKNLSDASSNYYDDEELLMLSGIQHYKFCPRQWALIHIEQQWRDNHLTLQGDIVHRKVNNPLDVDIREGVLQLRSVPLVSHTLGLSGIADILELTPTIKDDNSIKVPHRDGWWHIMPVEFKHGRPKRDDCDNVQLCAQAMCLEEMHHISIVRGEIFYATTRRRVAIEFTLEMRKQVIQLASEMHSLSDEGITPMAQLSPKCKSCSLNELCLVQDLHKSTTVNYYLKQLTTNDEKTT